MSTLELVIGGLALGVIAVFVAAMRYVSRRFGPGAVPAASIVDGAGPRWHAGRGRARMAGRAEAFTRVAIAIGLTSAVVMGACLVGMIVLTIVSKA